MKTPQGATYHVPLVLKVDVLDTIINSTNIWFTVDIYRSTDSNQSSLLLSVLSLKYMLIISPLYVYFLNYFLESLRKHMLFVPCYIIVSFVERHFIYFGRQLQYQPPAAPIRTKFIYSNYFYALAGYVAEKITGRSWEDLVQEYLFNPISMGQSGFVDHINKFDDFALGYSYLQEKPVKLYEKLL